MNSSVQAAPLILVHFMPPSEIVDMSLEAIETAKLSYFSKEDKFPFMVLPVLQIGFWNQGGMPRPLFDTIRM